MPDEISIIFKGYNQVDSVLKDLQKSLGGIPKLVNEINKSVSKGFKLDLSKSLEGFDTKGFDKGLKELSKGFTKELSTYKSELSKAYAEADTITKKSVKSFGLAEKAKTDLAKKTTTQIKDTWKQHETENATKTRAQGTTDSVYFNSKVAKAKTAATKLSSLEKQGAADVAAENKAKERDYDANLKKREKSFKAAKAAEAKATKKRLQDELAEIKKLTKAKDDLAKRSAAGTKTQSNSWSGLLMQLTKAGAQYLVVTESIKRLAAAMTKPFKIAINQVEMFNQAVIKVSALATSFTAAEPGANLAESYKEARQYSEGLVTALFELQKGTFATVQHMMLMTEEMAKQGVFLDANNAEQRKGFQSMANAVEVIAAGALQKEIQVRQEVRALLLGQIRMNDQLAQQLDRMLSSSGGLKAHLKIWKEEGTLIENIGALLKGYIAASEDIGKTWAAITTNFKSLIQIVFKKGFQKGYDDIIAGALKFQKVLDKNTETISKEMKLGWLAIKGTISSVWQILEAGLAVFDLISKSLGLVLKGVGNIALGFSSWDDDLEETDKRLGDINNTLDLLLATINTIGYFFGVMLPNAINSNLTLIKMLIEFTKELGPAFEEIGKKAAKSMVPQKVKDVIKGVESTILETFFGKKLSKELIEAPPKQKPRSILKKVADIGIAGEAENIKREEEYAKASLNLPAITTNAAKAKQILIKFQKELRDLVGRDIDGVQVSIIPNELSAKDKTRFNKLVSDIEKLKPQAYGKPEFSTKDIAKDTDILIAKEETYLKLLAEQAKRTKAIIALKVKTGDLTPIKAAEALQKVEEDIALATQASLEIQLGLLSKVSGKDDDIIKTKKDLEVITAKINDTEFKGLNNSVRMSEATKKEADAKVKVADAAVKLAAINFASIDEQIKLVKTLYDEKEKSLASDISINTEEAKTSALLALQSEEQIKINELTQQGFDIKIKVADAELTQLNLINASSNAIIIKEKEIIALKYQQVLANTLIAEEVKKAELAVLERQNKDLQTAFTLGDAFKQGLQEWVRNLKDTAIQMKNIAMDTATEMNKMFTDFFFDAFQGNLKTLGDYLTSFFNAVQKSMASMLANKVTGSIMSAFTGGGASASSIPSPESFNLSMPVTKHNGGIIGKPYKVSSGLKMDEVMIKGLTGEGIVSRKGMEALDSINKGVAPGGGSAPNVQFNISTPPGTEMDESETTVDFDFDTLVVNAVIKRRNQDPSFRKAMNI